MGKEYAYSGAVHPKSKFTKPVKDLMKKINEEFDTEFNSCLLNKYEDGNQYISAHSDDEKGLSRHMVIAVSIGSERVMKFRNKETFEIVKVVLTPGSLLMMKGKNFQKNWTHEITKQPSIKGCRISLTFREFSE